MDRGDPEIGAIFQIAGLPLPSHIDACACGARTIDIYAFRDNDHLRPRCTVCSVWYKDWISGEVLGEKRDRRASRFAVRPAVRFSVLRRDKHCCVHCGKPAPRAGDAFARVRELLVASVGSDRRLSLAQDAHASACAHCGQLLPGIMQSIPYEVYADLTLAIRAQIWQLLEAGRLTMDHLIPHALLNRDGVVRGAEELDIVNKSLLVTACMDCNWGRRDSLERWDEVKRVIDNVVLRGRPDQENVRGLAQQIYFRARLANERQVS